MKILFATAIVFSMILWIGCDQDEEGISGTYAGTQRFGIGQVSSPIVVEIRQEGNVISGRVLPPFASELVPYINGEVRGTTIRFDRKEGNITYRYEGTLRSPLLEGEFGPLGCIDPGSGEPCLTDSSGSFSARLQ
jgi:hypothetical protein